MSIENVKLSNRIYYEICSSCNLNCIHCSDLLANQKKYLNMSDIEKFQKKIAVIGVDEIVLTGGEPFLHPKIYEIIDIMCKLGKVYVTTNATLIDIDRINRLLGKYPNLIIQISFDAFNKYTFDLIRGKGVYDKVHRVIDELCARNKNKQIALSMTIMKTNIHEVKDVVEYVKSKNLSYLHFPELLCIGNAYKGWGEIAPNTYDQIQVEEYILNEIVKSDCSITCNRIQKICNMTNYGGKVDCSKYKTLKIVPSGDVLPCPVSSNLDFSIGKINDNNIFDKIKALNYEQNYLDIEKEKCSSCESKDICNQRFCSNCKYFNNDYEMEYTNYCCEIYSHHFQQIIKEVDDV